MQAGMIYTILAPGSVDLKLMPSKNSCGSDLFEIAIHCLRGLDDKYRLVLDYVYGYQQSAANRLLEYVKLDSDKRDLIVTLSLLELQNNQRYSERQCADFLNVSHSKYRRKYKETHYKIWQKLSRWQDVAEDYTRRR